MQSLAVGIAVLGVFIIEDYFNDSWQMDMFCLYYTMNTPGGSNFEKYGIHNMISFITIYFFIFKSTFRPTFKMKLL